ncbi:nucleotidyl transferase AbiEii/AbiGii toxin family protein [Rhizobium leguminosarum]|uniref:Nucleotidyl transferase AbiEii/AbiGii toxin family protein n=1 Tax=Rhizobium leguminosarum TaxID=384 RepID=A0A6P0AY59_RHILE|nr:nucleotidyl transferase AbiEii/AbiGii toxin family protein [Rhizobium leguminosarum]NEI32489.1 nucleotidyl transferase AbiEii/AbiGii toxin family protein [Rhizobium leguminosarum]NEI39248.1 nucleotidyl transferase AbiEii/AbiGii toxin family protein [Rhizobium leguminosarum]
MIPAQNIVAWGNVAPWPDQRQIEQDLIISRAVVAIFTDPFLREALRFRGGTALNKLHFPAPLRYSEDIDLVRTEAGPIGPVLDALRVVLEPWLGHGQYESSPVAPKLKFRIEAEDGGGVPIRLKVETNISEIEAYDPPIDLPFGVTNPWFTGNASVPTFSREEMLATKLRALLQREKGRDLYDLAHGLETFEGLNVEKVADFFGRYVALSGQVITRAQAEQRMFAKLARPRFLTDMQPLLPTQQAEALTDQTTLQSFTSVFAAFIERLPGDTWLRTAEMRKRFGVV